MKTKAGTNYVNNELAKNGNTTTLNNYALETDLQTLASEASGALNDKIDTHTSANYFLATTINALLNSKANKSDITNDLASKLNLSDFNTALDLKQIKLILQF